MFKEEKISEGIWYTSLAQNCLVIMLKLLWALNSSSTTNLIPSSVFSALELPFFSPPAFRLTVHTRAGTPCSTLYRVWLIKNQLHHLLFTVNVWNLSLLFLVGFLFVDNRMLTAQKAMSCLNVFVVWRKNEDLSVDELSHFMVSIVVFAVFFNSQQCDSLSAIGLSKFRQMEVWRHDKFHFTCWPVFEFQVLSCVCLFREITAASHLSLPVFLCVQRPYNWHDPRRWEIIGLSCCVNKAFVQAGNSRMFLMSYNYE